MSAPAPGPLVPRTPRPRRGSVWLIDRRFQLKYTLWIVGLVLAVALGLGVAVARMGHTALHQAEVAAEFAERAHQQSQSNSKLARDNALLVAGDNPALLKLMEQSIAEADQRSMAELEKVRTASGALQQSAQRLQGGLVLAVLALCVLLTLIGLRVTQRIVGPVHRLKRLLRRVGTGRLSVSERLRKGDELEDLFDTFRQMTYSLKALQRGRLATLEVVIQDAHASGASSTVQEGLAALRAQLQLGLGVEAAMKRSGERRSLRLGDESLEDSVAPPPVGGAR